MPELRFPGADVFEAFPIAYEDIETQPNDQSSLVFLRELVKGPKPEDAVPFCAYLLPRREAVWWASQCVRMLLADLTERDNAALRAAEEWVREPEELNRQRAHQIGTMANQRAARHLGCACCRLVRGPHDRRRIHEASGALAYDGAGGIHGGSSRAGQQA